VKTKNIDPAIRRTWIVVFGMLGVFAFANAVYHSYRAYQICPPGILPLGLVFVSLLGLIISFAIFVTLLVIEFSRRTKMQNDRGNKL
jgi:hypothetical protein